MSVACAKTPAEPIQLDHLKTSASNSVETLDDAHARLGVRRVINAAGTYTPLGVSRSSQHVAAACASALAEFFIIEELQDVVGAKLASFAGTESAYITHCAAAGITLSIAAAMTGTRVEAVAALPRPTGVPTRVVLPANHAVNYGHPISTDVRLAGATPVLVGNDGYCTIAQVEQAVRGTDVACLLLVASRLTSGAPIDLTEAVTVAHQHDVPVVIDGAAQDMRVRELVQTGADAIVLSGHKYLAAPTVGLIVGKRNFISAVRLQETGIGRAMKPSKEAIVGLDAALRERSSLNIDAWRAEQHAKAADFISRVGRLTQLQAKAVPDPAGMPFPRVHLTLDGGPEQAEVLVKKLKAGNPAIWVMEHGLACGELILELVPLDDSEMSFLIDRLAQLTATN